MKVVSLFSGCGGLDWGFKKEGFDIIWANDLIEDVCLSYEKNIGDHIVCENILNVNVEDIPKADLLIGGPPCQGFSGIGKRDPNDERSMLVWTFLDILSHVKPSMFLFENVVGLKSAKSPNGCSVIDSLISEFGKLGYHINVFTLNAADYGVPQKRRRVFILGNNRFMDIGEPKKTHSENNSKYKKWVSSGEALGDLNPPNDEGIGTYCKEADNDFLKFIRQDSDCTDLHYIPKSSEKDMEIIKCVTPGGNYMDVPDEIATKRILNIKKTGGRTTTYGRLDPKEPAYTINTYFDRPNVGCNIHFKEDRLISLREGLRLQSFPDNFSLVSSTKRNYYLQIGNAVPPLLSWAWAKHIKKIMSRF